MDKNRREEYIYVSAAFLVLSLLVFSSKLMAYLENSHGWVSSEQLAMILRSTYEYGFVGFRNWFSTGFDYFPKVPFINYLVFNIILLPFKNPWSQLFAARLVMDLVFLLSVFLSYKVLREETKDWRISLGATLLGFSGYFMAFYHDMISPEAFTLLSFIISAWAFQKFQSQDLKKGFGYVLLSSLMGHLVINILPYMVYFVLNSARYFKDKNPARLKLLKISLLALSLSAFFSGSFLVYNVYREAKLRNVDFDQTDIFTSGKRRMDINSDYQQTYGEDLAWHKYTYVQTLRLGQAIIPYILQRKIYGWILGLFGLWGLFWVSKNRMVAALISRVKTAALEIRVSVFIFIALAGCFPFIILRGYALPHDFSAIYFVLPATLIWYLILKTLSTKHYLPVFILSLGILCSSFLRSTVKKNAMVGTNEEILKEFSHINELISSSHQKVFYLDGHKEIVPKLPHVVGAFMTNHIIAGDLEKADYIISMKNDGKSSLTPDHKHIFLIKPAP